MERRKYIRAPEKVEFYYKLYDSAKNDWIHGYTQNLCLGGSLAWLKGRLPLGARLYLRLSLNFLNRGSTVCNLPAMVVRHAETSLSGEEGVGLIFLHERAGGDRALLGTYLNEKDEIRKRGRQKVLLRNDTLKREMEGAKPSKAPGKRKKKGFISRIFGNG